MGPFGGRVLMPQSLVLPTTIVRHVHVDTSSAYAYTQPRWRGTMPSRTRNCVLSTGQFTCTFHFVIMSAPYSTLVLRWWCWGSLEAVVWGRGSLCQSQGSGEPPLWVWQQWVWSSWEHQNCRGEDTWEPKQHMNTMAVVIGPGINNINRELRFMNNMHERKHKQLQ